MNESKDRLGVLNHDHHLPRQVVGDAHESAMENISLVSWGLNWLQSADTREWSGSLLISLNSQGYVLRWDRHV